MLFNCLHSYGRQILPLSEKSTIVFFSRPGLFQTSLLTLSQMHVVDFSESVLHVGNLLYPPETIYILEQIRFKRVASQY